jgi:glycosyltransferase involved in cell wall biosynthesis
MQIAYRGHKIIFVGSTDFKAENAKIIDRPEHLAHVSARDLCENYEVWHGQVLHKNEVETRPSSELKIAMICSYGVNCGISTYSKYLCDEIRPRVKELRIFSEQAEAVDRLNDEKDQVTRCWSRRGDYLGMLAPIEEYDPDIIYIQHEYGCFNHGANWNVLLGHLSRWRVITVLHSVYDHPDKLIFEAPCREIIVHSKGGRDLLKRRGINHAPIHHIPHGCLSPIESQLRFSQISNDHVIFQYGFGFEYKGWENAIRIVEKLKEKYPDVLYVGVFNISRFSQEFSEGYYERLMDEVRAKKLQANFVLHKGFRSEEVLLSYLKQARVGLFPYWNHPEWRVYGASGAIRLVLASGIPIVLGDVPFFEEFKGHVPVCSEIDQYVAEISQLFEDYAYEQSVKKKIRDFIDARSWDKIAQWYLSVTKAQELTAL